MRKGIVLFLLVNFVFFASCNSQVNPEGADLVTTLVKDVSVDELKSAIDQKEDILILDVRTVREVKSSHIQNSIHIDINGASFNDEVNSLDKDKTIYVYCKVGGRSSMACKKMVKMGFKDVRNISGGIMEWERKELPTIKE